MGKQFGFMVAPRQTVVTLAKAYLTGDRGEHGPRPGPPTGARGVYDVAARPPAVHRLQWRPRGESAWPTGHPRRKPQAGSGFVSGIV